MKQETVAVPRHLLTVCAAAAQKLQVMKQLGQPIAWRAEFDELLRARSELRRLDGWEF